MKLRDLLKENEDYQSALTQVANLETNVSKMIEQEGKVNTLRMLLNLHDSFGEGKYNRPKRYKAELPYISDSEFSIAGVLKLAIDFIMYPSIDGRDSDMFEAEQFLKTAKKRAVEELSDETNPIYPGYTSTITENKTSELRNIIRKEIKKSLNEGIFGSSPDKEKRKLEDALDRFVKYSIDEGSSEADVLSALEKYSRSAVDIYLGGKISDEELDRRYDDIFG